jgi:hypothetical protein
MGVVVVYVLLEHGTGMPPVDDQEAVEEFATEAADEAFGDRVGSRCLHRCFDDPDVDGGEDRVERGGELGVTVPDGNRKRRPASSRSMSRLRACWVSQAPPVG